MTLKVPGCVRQLWATKPPRSETQNALFSRNLNNQTFTAIVDPDLAGKPGTRISAFREIQHRLFHRARRAEHRAPLEINIDVASHAGAVASAFRFNAWHIRAERRLHDRHAGSYLDQLPSPVRLDISDC